MVRCPVLALLCCLHALPLLAAPPPHAAVTAEAGEESVEVESSQEQDAEHSQVRGKLQISTFSIIIFLGSSVVYNVLVFSQGQASGYGRITIKRGYKRRPLI